MATTAEPSSSTKRLSEADASQPPIIKKPRRNPALSCQLCRVKKIKCDRNRPCSNCVTRKVQCVPQDGFSSPPRDFQFTLAQSPSPENSHGSPGIHSYSYSDPHALAGSVEARRLSEAAMRGPSGMSMLSLAASREAPLQDRDSNRAASLLEEIAMGSETYVHNNTGKSPATDGSYMKSPEEDEAPVRPPILSTLKLFSSSRALHPAALQDLNRLLTQLPPLSHARPIIANFVRLVHPLYHILHTGFIYELLDDMYSSDRNQPRKDKVAARLSLLYTILAIGAYFWRDADRDLVTGLTTDMLMPLSKQWRDASIEALSLGNFMSPAKDTIESLQALCLLQLVLHNDGESESYRHLAGSVIRMAQTLGLHCLGSTAKAGESRITFELKRRLWWFICSSDWLESTHGGARQGLYTINRRLVDTSLPNNTDDEYITDTMCQSNNLSTPTTMSYFLVRSELSYVCLEAIEVLGMKAYSGDSEVDYDKLLSIDHKYRNFLKNLPVYYRNDARSRTESEEIIKTRPYIGWQRTMVHVGIHCMLIRLHRPFLIRGSQQPRYAFSRMTCLRSAHNILKMIRGSLSENADFWHVMRLWIGVHHLFMAAAVLSIDLCWNDDDEPHADSTRDEVLEACKILEKARDQSTIAEHGINVLYAIMRRWKDSSGSDTDREQLLNLNKSINAEEPMSADSSAAALRLTTTQPVDTPTMHAPSSNAPLISGFDPSQGPLFSASELSDFGSFGNGSQVMDWSGLLEGLDAASDSWFMPSMTG